MLLSAVREADREPTKVLSILVLSGFCSMSSATLGESGLAGLEARIARVDIANVLGAGFGAR